MRDHSAPICVSMGRPKVPRCAKRRELATLEMIYPVVLALSQRFRGSDAGAIHAVGGGGCSSGSMRLSSRIPSSSPSSPSFSCSFGWLLCLAVVQLTHRLNGSCPWCGSSLTAWALKSPIQGANSRTSTPRGVSHNPLFGRLIRLTGSGFVVHLLGNQAEIAGCIYQIILAHS